MNYICPIRNRYVPSLREMFFYYVAGFSVNFRFGWKSFYEEHLKAVKPQE